MKRIIELILLTSVCCMLSSCNDEQERLIIDYTPVVLKVDVVNTQGDNLLDESYAGNILDKELTITYKGNTTQISRTAPEALMPQSRALMPHWYGAFIMSGENYWTVKPVEPAIFIGEFDGGLSGTVALTLQLGDKSFDLSYKAKVNMLDVDRTFYIDGKKNEGKDQYTIVL